MGTPSGAVALAEPGADCPCGTDVEIAAVTVAFTETVLLNPAEFVAVTVIE